MQKGSKESESETSNYSVQGAVHKLHWEARGGRGVSQMSTKVEGGGDQNPQST